MMLEQQTEQATIDFTLPWDLRQWVELERLVNWSHEIVGGLDWGNPDLELWQRANPYLQPRQVLSTLTLAYAIGIYDAEEIESACFKDNVFKSLWGGLSQARASQLNQFRKQNRGLLKYCLVELFKRAFKTHFQLGEAFIPAGIRKHLLESAVARLDMARQVSRSPDSL